MPKPAQRIIIAVLFLILLVTILFLVVHGPGPEPKYQGQYLTDWAWQLQGNLNPQERQEAITAIRAMCSDKIPMLVTWLDYDPFPRRHKLSTAFGWLPTTWSSTIEEKLLPDTNERRAETAQIVLTVLGPELTPVIPQLTKMVNSTNDSISERVSNLAGGIGSNGLAILLPIATDTNNPRQFDALATVALMEDRPSNAAPAVRALAASTQSPNSNIVSIAAMGLGIWKAEPEVSLPALLPLLSHRDTKARAAATRAVGAFGDSARSAIPLLVKSLDDPSPKVRVQATNAILKIAPEILTNAQSQ